MWYALIFREFVKGDRVLAVYPVNQTTVLYPATVAVSAKKVALVSSSGLFLTWCVLVSGLAKGLYVQRRI